jgi:hypothetical protein
VVAVGVVNACNTPIGVTPATAATAPNSRTAIATTPIAAAFDVFLFGSFGRFLQEPLK